MQQSVLRSTVLDLLQNYHAPNEDQPVKISYASVIHFIVGQNVQYTFKQYSTNTKEKLTKGYLKITLF